MRYTSFFIVIVIVRPYLWRYRNLTRLNVKFVCFANKFSYLFGRYQSLRSN